MTKKTNEMRAAEFAANEEVGGDYAAELAIESETDRVAIESEADAATPSEAVGSRW